MQEEDRNTGQIGLEVYKIYLKAAGGYLLALLVVFFLMAAGAADGEIPFLSAVIRCHLIEDSSVIHLNFGMVDKQDNPWI